MQTDELAGCVTNRVGILRRYKGATEGTHLGRVLAFEVPDDEVESVLGDPPRARATLAEEQRERTMEATAIDPEASDRATSPLRETKTRMGQRDEARARSARRFEATGQGGMIPSQAQLVEILTYYITTPTYPRTTVT